METRNPQSTYAKKKLKLCSGNNEDRISSLPDNIIHHILSSLNMRVAVKTSILSKRWRYIWTSLPTLNFISEPLIRMDTMDTCDEHGFIQFIDQVLVLRDGSDIEKFILLGDRDLINRLNTWICYAVRRNVQELSMTFNANVIPPLPHCLFTCKSLTSLTINAGSPNYIELVLPHSVDLCVLKILHLEHVMFIDESTTNKLLSSCPDLESLVIAECQFSVMNLIICYQKLNFLRFDNYSQSVENSVRGKVEFYTPNLRGLNFSEYIERDYFVEEFPSLVEADILMATYDEEDEPAEIPLEKKELFAQRMMRLLKALRYVKYLTLYGLAIELISRASDLLHRTPLLFNNLISLDLHSWLSRDCIHAITYLLKISPNIRTLSLAMWEHPCRKSPPVYPYFDEVTFSSTNMGDYWGAGLSMECLMCNLKSVEIYGLEGCVNELKFLEILLKNASVLEKLVIHTSRSNETSWQRLMKFNKKLLEFPKATSSITISFSTF